MTYHIESRNLGHRMNTEWDRDTVEGGMGSNVNTFDSMDEAESTIGELQTLGGDWAAAEYRVIQD